MFKGEKQLSIDEEVEVKRKDLEKRIEVIKGSVVSDIKFEGFEGSEPIIEFEGGKKLVVPVIRGSDDTPMFNVIEVK